MIPNSKEKQSFLQTSGQDAGTQCLSRTRSVFRGHTVPFAPTADARRLFAPTAGTKCLSRLRRSLRKQTEKSLFSAPYGKPYRSKARIFIKATIAAPPHVRNRSIKYRRTQSRELPGLDPCCLLGKSLPFHFPICSYAIVTAQWTHSVFSRLRRSLRKQTAKSLLSAPYGKALQKQEKPPKDRKPSFRISCEKEKH